MLRRLPGKLNGSIGNLGVSGTTMPSADALHSSLTAARTCLEDLQAEIEAGSRCAERIHVNATIDDRVLLHQQEAARLGALRRCAEDLKASIAQQRGILQELRRSIDELRRAMRNRR